MDFSTSFGISFLVPTKINGDQRASLRELAEAAENNPNFENMLSNITSVAYQPQQVNPLAYLNFSTDTPFAERKAILEPQQGVGAYQSTAELLAGDNPQVSIGLLSRRVAEISNSFAEALRTAGIPAGPESLTFDENGNIVLPEGYEDLRELNKLFASKPELKESLADINRIAQAYLRQQQDYNLSDDLLNLGHTQLNLTRTGYISGFNIEV